MRNNLYLLIGIFLLYLAPSIVLKVTYGPSYDMWSGEDCWVPDGNGGWRSHGDPAASQPDVPSENVPILASYLPIFLPALLLILFMFTPLSRKLETKKEPEPDEEDNPDPPEKN